MACASIKTPLRFHMFGNVFDRQKDLESARKGMTLGILSSTLEYLALMGKRISEDISISHMVLGSGVMDMRIPLISTYSANRMIYIAASSLTIRTANAKIYIEIYFSFSKK